MRTNKKSRLIFYIFHFVTEVLIIQWISSENYFMSICNSYKRRILVITIERTTTSNISIELFIWLQIKHSFSDRNSFKNCSHRTVSYHSNVMHQITFDSKHHASLLCLTCPNFNVHFSFVVYLQIFVHFEILWWKW